ncbi:MAG: amidase [Halolamina sp.]|uniref:amidase n=1 Tax=Halolamina sp. TaxID=1940283 RepID=UPI002FC3A6C7
MAIHEYSATELAVKIRQGDLSPVEVVDAYVDRIEQRNDRINAFVTVCDERARQHAQEAEDALERGEDVGPLHGVPVGIKDLQPVAGVRTTFGSKLYEDHVPEADSEIVRRLKDAGAIVLGKTNAPEFGLEGTTDNYLFGPTSTPFDAEKNAGGSSGGSAAAVADGLVPIAQGSDGGGSIRIPASFCGVYGFKASFGRIPAAGSPNKFVRHTPFLHVGPLTRTVEDAALLMDILAGPSRHDPFSLPETESSYHQSTRQPIDDLEIAYSPDLGLFPIDERVQSAVESATTDLAATGATVEEAELEFEYSRAEILDAFGTMFDVHFAYQAACEIDSLPARMDDVTPEIAKSIRHGEELSAVDYRSLELIRTAVFDTIQSIFDDYDLLVTPTLAVPPFDNDDPDIFSNDILVGPGEVAGEEIDPRDGWTLCTPFNMSGHPVASIPCGFTGENLPIGMQIVGGRHADTTVLAASAAFERLSPWQQNYQD